MEISKTDVEKVARLAKLRLSPEELETMAAHLNPILGYVEKLKELDTDGVEPMAHAVPMANAFREDVVTPSIGIARALQNAPVAGDDCFTVPKVIE